MSEFEGVEIIGGTESEEGERFINVRDLHFLRMLEAQMIRDVQVVTIKSLEAEKFKREAEEKLRAMGTDIAAFKAVSQASRGRFEALSKVVGEAYGFDMRKVSIDEETLRITNHDEG